MRRLREAYRHAASDHGTVGEAIDWLVRPGLTRVARNPVRWATTFFLIGLLLGGVTFSLFEPKTSVPDGLWWAYISMMTVGYGDLAPKDTIERVIAVFVIANGALAFSILTGAFGAKIVQLRTDAAHETPELEDDIEEAIEHITDKLRVLQTRVRERDKEFAALQRTNGGTG